MCRSKISKSVRGQGQIIPEMIKLNQVNMECIWDQMLSFLHLDWKSLFHINLIKCSKNYFENAQMHSYFCGVESPHVIWYDMI